MQTHLACSALARHQHGTNLSAMLAVHALFVQFSDIGALQGNNSRHCAAIAGLPACTTAKSACCPPLCRNLRAEQH
jgi:hypothetical protein